jgi:phage terminase large subunit-like protein
MPGSGKSWAGCLELLRWSDLPNYTGVGLRAVAKDLMKGPTSLFGTLKSMSAPLGGRATKSPRPTITFRAGGEILLEHAANGKEGFDGLEIALSFFDELQHFEFDFFDYLVNSRGRTTCGLNAYARASCMPTNDIWLTEWARPWLDSEGYAKFEESGKTRWMYIDDQKLPVWFDDEAIAREVCKSRDPLLTPTSVAFVFAKTEHNLELMRLQPEYREKLARLTGVERQRLALGCWFANPESAGFYTRRWFKILDKAPDQKDIVFSCRGWDRAATLPCEKSPNPDWTRGARLDLLRSGLVVVSDMKSIRNRPGPVKDLIQATVAEDGPYVTQAFNRDPGSSGVDEEETLRALLARTSGCGPCVYEADVQFRGKIVRGKAWSIYADQDTPDAKPGMAVVRGPWNGPFFSEIESFPDPEDKLKNDQVDAVSTAWTEVAKRLPHGGSVAQLFLAAARSR